jgi:hypothetical protein
MYIDIIKIYKGENIDVTDWEEDATQNPQYISWENTPLRVCGFIVFRLAVLVVFLSPVIFVIWNILIADSCNN